MIWNWYNQIQHPALKTKMEITKYINWQQFTKGTRGKQESGVQTPGPNTCTNLMSQ